jgi:hypothetical protein
MCVCVCVLYLWFSFSWVLDFVISDWIWVSGVGWRFVLNVSFCCWIWLALFSSLINSIWVIDYFLSTCQSRLFRNSAIVFFQYCAICVTDRIEAFTDHHKWTYATLHGPPFHISFYIGNTFLFGQNASILGVRNVSDITALNHNCHYMRSTDLRRPDRP